MYTLLKSEVGPFPEPSFPRGIDLPAEDRRARGRLYPVTAIYFTFLFTMLVLALRSSNTLRALAFAALGLAAWTLVEYLAHRHMMHRAFPKGAGLRRRILHYLFDASHADHHARPWDGLYINGHLDTLLVAGVAVPASFLAPPCTASVAVATFFACYAAEEWVHHALHFWNFDSGYFQYLRRRHLYHHSRHGVGMAYGITSGLWDTVFGTRIPVPERQRLLPGRGAPTALADDLYGHP
jgi:sterol desaturase/sphingolipid hydroxylase (fatty acid hydroxylase superfamily)